MKKIIFRELKKEDEGRKAHFIELFKFLTDKEVLKLDIEALAMDDRCFCLVIEEEETGRIIGFGSLIIYRTPLHGFVGRFEDIVIHGDYQKKGLGEKLCNIIIRKAEDMELNHIDLTSSRPAVQKMYGNKHGFVKRETMVMRRNFT